MNYTITRISINGGFWFTAINRLTRASVQIFAESNELGLAEIFKLIAVTEDKVLA